MIQSKLDIDFFINSFLEKKIRGKFVGIFRLSKLEHPLRETDCVCERTALSVCTFSLVEFKVGVYVSIKEKEKEGKVRRTN